MVALPGFAWVPRSPAARLDVRPFPVHLAVHAAWPSGRWFETPPEQRVYAHVDVHADGHARGYVHVNVHGHVYRP
jgi:hypothetical protein